MTLFRVAAQISAFVAAQGGFKTQEGLRLDFRYPGKTGMENFLQFTKVEDSKSILEKAEGKKLRLIKCNY